MTVSDARLDAGGAMSVRSMVTTNGIELAYTEHGDGEPLLLIMGLGADGSAWEPHVAAYQERYRCIAVDNRGVGASSKPVGPYSTAEMADDYAGLIQALNLGRVRVVGISMGGAIAQELALRHPELVERLGLVATWARSDAYTQDVLTHFARSRAALSPQEFAQLLQLWLWTPEYVNQHLSELIQARQLLGLWLWEPGYVNQHLSEVIEALARHVEADVVQPQHAFEAQCEACITHDTLDRLDAIRVPTLVTAGDLDTLIRFPLSEQLQARIPGAQLQVFRGNGHVHHWEALDEFNRSTMEWLGQ
jgi:pimeloyl-ACP methyl ester carboxylesterase